jgi:phage gp45-like
MGIKAELIRVVSSVLKRFPGSPAAQAIVSGKGAGGVNIEAEAYQPHGVFGRPPANTNAVFIPVGDSKRMGVVFGLANYNFGINIEQGELMLYSTTTDGKSIKSRLQLTKDGDIYLNGADRRLVTYDELNTALQGLVSALNAHVHPSTGAPPATPMTLDISNSRTITIRTGG